MVKQIINVGVTPNDRRGDPVRIAFQKSNDNFTELYTNVATISNEVSTLSDVAFSGSYTDLLNIPPGGTGGTSDRLVNGANQVTLGTDGTVTFPYGHLIGTGEGDMVLQSSGGITLAHTTGTPFSWDSSIGIYGSTVSVTSGNGVWNFGNNGTFYGPLMGGLKVAGYIEADKGNGLWLSAGAPNDVTETIQITNADGPTAIVYIDLAVNPNAANIPSDAIFSPTGNPADNIIVNRSGPSFDNNWELLLSGIIQAVQGASYNVTYPGTVYNNVSINAQNGSWTFGNNGILTLPVGGDIKDNDGNSVLGGGTTGPVQPYLRLTNEPFIVQPAVLGTPVTITAAPAGINALFQVDILEGPVLGGITVTQGGTGYVVGQNYIIYSYQLGGPMPSDSLTFTVETVDETGGILTVTNAQFLGAPQNTPGSYGSVDARYIPSVFDAIGPGLTLVRGWQQGLYNSDLELDYDNNTYLSPLGTEWNSSGWGDLLGLGTRTYTTWRSALNNQVGSNIVASELVMHDIANEKYYKFDFSAWGGQNNSYSYIRTEVTDPNYFRKPHNVEVLDIVASDEPAGSGVGIVRTDGTGIWNIFQETGYSDANSPLGTTWNVDGWDNLTNLTTRTYTSFYTATGQNYNDVMGKQFVMYVASTGKYYAIKFLEWATNGDNNFAYVRYEIDQTKLNEGITFPDGTALKSAAGIGRIKSTAVGNRRIEEVTGYDQVSVTGRVTSADIPATVYGSAAENLNWYVDIVWDADLGVYLQGTTPYSLTVSTDGGNTWYPAYVGGYNTDVSQQIVVTGGQTVLQAAADSVIAYRVITGAEPIVWWDKNDLPGGGQDFRGAVIDYHAWTGESTIIGTIHIVDDANEEHISHQEVQSGSTDGENDDLWLVQNEGAISYRRIDGEAKTLKVHWTAKVFYGSEFWD